MVNAGMNLNYLIHNTLWVSGPEGSPRVLDDMRIWFAVAFVLVALAYGIPIYDLVSDGLLAPGSAPIGV